ncbi:hypothetical protein Cgig2_014137 [Carnegiea gigantea]|uniref:ENTH domain-containing protein n=1 Tax=Carnegiea gigantea TaxID=171969 RepID=A0A9Q1JY58_9CARY|nr:hypothetical protein Cgig2_014137 [Carnegiea gigantea]
MAPSIRKAVGQLKDQTSIGLAKVASDMAPEIEVAIVKATSHDSDPADEKYIRRILTFTSYNRMYVNACITAISRRLGKTRDWIVALKALMLIHRLMNDGDPVFQQEILYATRRGTRLLNLSDFRDEAHSNSWDHSAFVRTYALYLDQRLELMLFERKQGSKEGGSGQGGEIVRYEPREDLFRSPPSQFVYDYGEFRDEPRMRRTRSYGDFGESNGRAEEKAVTPLREWNSERIFAKMGHLQRLLDRFLACRPTGMGKSSRMILVALYPVLRESFKLYGDICEVLAVLLDKFFDMENSDCLKAFDAYSSAAKQIDELVAFYKWCKDTGVARSSEFPEVQRITAAILQTLEEFVRDRTKRPKSPDRKPEPAPETMEEEPAQDINEIKALPAPENFTSPPPLEPEPKPESKQITGDLVDLREEGETADSQGNKFALALFAGPADNANGSWQAFSSDGKPEVTSAWQNPAAEQGKEDWELALVETASNLSKQKAAMGGGLDPLLLNGMYDQGMVRQHVSSSQMSGSASSVALPGPGKNSTPVLALPGPDGSLQTVGGDPFAASLIIPPPAYVQMADLEKKQHLLVQERVVWQQYAQSGMQGQSSFARVGGPGYVAPGASPMTILGASPVMPHGIPPMNGMMPPPTGFCT